MFYIFYNYIFIKNLLQNFKSNLNFNKNKKSFIFQMSRSPYLSPDLK